MNPKKIAKDYLSTLDARVLYQAEPHNITEYDDHFVIAFARLKPFALKGDAIIWVDKKSGKPEWIGGK